MDPQSLAIDPRAADTVVTALAQVKRAGWAASTSWLRAEDFPIDTVAPKALSSSSASGWPA